MFLAFTCECQSQLTCASQVEFDRPSALLARPDSALCGLVKESSDRDYLYQLAGVNA